MSYAYQTFNSGQTLTGGQTQQLEDNIRDHVHGKDGVAAAGVAWQVSSRGTALTVASTDVGKLYECYGDFDVTFPTAGSLGGSFASAFKNLGSGRVALVAASGQWIEGNSLYAMAPGESVIAQSDNSNLILVGAQHGLVRLARFAAVGSLANAEIKHFYPGDFEQIIVRQRGAFSATAVLQAEISLDSGSSYLASGYTNTMTGATTLWALNDGGVGSVAAFSEFTYSPNPALGTVARGLSIRGTTALEYNLTNSNVGIVNAMRFSPSAGSFQSGMVVEVFGRGRIRAVI